MIIDSNNFIDESTRDEFKFIFRCESCGKIILEYSCKNEDDSKLKFFSKNRLNETKWIKNHNECLKKAKEQALDRLNRCEVCGKLICDDCSVEDDLLSGGICCRKCSLKINKKEKIW